MIGPYSLACLDMAGTIVRDDGVVDEAFTVALQSAGVDLGSPRFASARSYVQATMGQSKADVFAGLLDPEAATAATAAFAQAYERIVAEGRVSPIRGALETIDGLRLRGVKVCLTTGFAPSTRDALIRSLGWSTHIDLALQGILAYLVPAAVELALVLGDLVLGRMVRSVHGPSRKVHVERTLGG